MAAAAIVRFGLRADGASDVLAGLAVVTALLFGLQLTVFDNAVKASRDPMLIGDGSTFNFLMKLRKGLSYTVAVGLVGTSLLVGLGMFVTPPWPVWLSAVVAALLVHFVTLLFVLLRRLTVAFHLLRG